MNNRQGGRRRGRGGQRPQGIGGGGGGSGNSRDQRVRGNAAQLLEKYKNMARDAQLAGDRVQTEYYLQFADHYFRVLGETRSRFEDQRPSRDDDEDDGEYDLVDGDGDEESSEQPRAERQPRQDRSDRFERRDRPERNDRPERAERFERGDRPERNDRAERPERSDRPERAERPERSDRERPRRERLERRPVRDEELQEEQPALGIADFLPPAIGPITSDEPSVVDTPEEEAPKPRRRTRRPRAAEGDDEVVAPAA